VNPLRRLTPGLLACAVLGPLSGTACNSVNSDPASAPEAFAGPRSRLVAELRAEGITDDRVLSAMARVPRHLFVLPHDRDRAYVDEALPIAGNQTISQPYIVALMTQLLELRGGERVLEVGTGSGYQAAVLALMAREVYSIEIDPALARSAQERLHALGYANVTVHAGDGFYGWPERAPFEAVVITAVAPEVPQPLVAQLAPGGRLVMPLGDSDRQTLVRGRKQADGTLSLERVAAVAFVPMRGAVRQPPSSRTPSGTPGH
jgi:protein-L-isoaspartate(D-aspartate) O-methyltransferase